MYLGKEANKIVMQESESNHVEMYQDIEKMREFILNLTPAKAKEIGITHRSELSYLKKKAREGKLNFNTPVMRKILKYYSS